MPDSPQNGPANAPGDYDVFLSYAHSDDIGGIVPALHEQLESDFQRLLHRPVELFLDRSDIRDFDQWQVRCHRALRASRFFIVLLSPAYLTSDACRWEWETWMRHEVEHGQVGQGAACLWFIEIASFDAAGDAERLRLWKNELRQRFRVEFHAWREGGREALQDTAARTELARLTDHVAQRLRLLALDRGQRGNLGWPQDRFVGREVELRLLREHLLDAAPSAPVALIGIGGMGKTALALTFAFREADAFPGGRWLLRCEGHARLDTAMRPLVQDLGIALTEPEKADETLAARRVLDTLRPRGPALFLLDNVDTPALLAPDSLALLSGESGIRLLLTTRLAPGEFAAAGASVTAIDLDQLPEDQALDLIRLHQPDAAFASAADENDAREIVRALGGLTLAVETAAVYLGQNDSRVADPRYAVRIADYLETLRRDLAGTGEAEPDVRPGDVVRQLREVAATIRPTLARLDAPARTVLQLAALLHPDAVPLPWLRAIAGKFHPSLATDAAIAERDEWTDLIRALIGMRLLHPTNEPRVLTIHRLLQRVFDTELREQRDGLAAKLDAHLANREGFIYRTQSPPADWELGALLDALPARLGHSPDHILAHNALFLTQKIRPYRTLPAVAGFVETVHEVLAKFAASDPANVESQRDLSVSLNQLGDLAVAQGDLGGAFRSFTKSKIISERLTANDPANAEWQRGLSVALNQLGNVAVAQGDLAGAFRSFTESKTILERLAASNPANAECQRDLSVSLGRLGDVAVVHGDLAVALSSFAESQAINERLAASDPANAEWQRDLWMSNGKLGDLAMAQGNIPEAFRFWTAANDITERLAASDPANSERQRDLSVSFGRLGGLAVAQGDLVGALRSFTKSKTILERLAATDPANTVWQCDLSASLNQLGDLAVAQGDLAGAFRSFTESKTILERLAASDPANAEWQRGLSVSLYRLADIEKKQGRLPEALLQFTEYHRMVERLAASNPANAECQRDLSMSLNKLGELAVAQGNLAGAVRSFTESRTIRERLAASDPANAKWQRDLSVSLQKLGEIALAQGDLAGAVRSFTENQTISERLAASDPTNAEWQRDLSVSFHKLALVAAQAGEGVGAARHFRASHNVLRGMKTNGLHLDPGIAAVLEQLDQFAPQNYAGLIAAAADSSATAPPHTHQIITTPDPLAQPRREVGIEELRESARFNFSKCYWEATAMDLQKLLARGDPLEELAPKIVTCLLNAHETLMAPDAATIEDLIHRLEAAGHPTLAADLRRQLESKQPKPKKPWWKLW